MNSKHSFARKGLFVAISVLALGVSGAAMAGTANDNLAVSADVIDNCTISTTALTFGNYDPIVTNLSAELDNTGMVTITCTKDDVVSVALGMGENAVDTQRKMADGAELLNYSLFSDPGRLTVWNDSVNPVSATGTGAAQNLTVYGRVDAGQNVSAGTYTDTVIATVTF
jgi:spore coat protein U-like protein